jgi:predicted porin
MFGGLLKSTSRLALVAAAATVVGGVSAQAADLGGNCCADLEERVAELEATTARKGNRKVSLTVSGQVNKAIVWHDSNSTLAHRSETFSIQENEASQTRFRFVGSAKIDADRTAGYVLEIGLSENEGVNFSTASNNRIRQNHVFIRSASLGQLSLGQQSAATDGIADISLSGLTFVNNQNGVLVHSRLVGNRVSSFYDANGPRMQAIRYDSPTFAGFTFSASWGHAAPTAVEATDPDGDSDIWDVALRYVGEFNGVRLAAGIGYRQQQFDSSTAALATTVDDIFLGSASIMHVPTGLYVSGGASERDRNTIVRGGDLFSWWAQAGIQKNWFGIGNTTVYGEYHVTDSKSPVSTGAAATSFADGSYWGVGFVQNIAAAASDVYISYRNYEADGLTTGNLANSEDITVIQAGMIVRF